MAQGTYFIKICFPFPTACSSQCGEESPSHTYAETLSSGVLQAQVYWTPRIGFSRICGIDEGREVAANRIFTLQILRNQSFINKP